MNTMKDNIEKLHTTELGVERIRKNLKIDQDDVIAWCKERIASREAAHERRGKNWYVYVEDMIFTVNATSWTIITAHRKK